MSSEENKEADPKLKKEASYTYWVNNDPNFFKEGLKPETTPQKLESNPINKASPNIDAGHSAWNTAGTWEEKILKFEDVQKLFETEFKEFVLSDKRILIKGIKNLSGDVHLVLSRGKKRLGYHLKFTLAFEGLEEWKNYRGNIKFVEFTDDGEREMDLDIVVGEDEKGVRDAIKKSGELISTNILNILNIFKN